MRNKSLHAALMQRENRLVSNPFRRITNNASMTLRTA